VSVSDIKPHRLDSAQIEKNFGELHPALSKSEAIIEADRCYFCFDAPCTTACPTGIDIPRFIQQIRSGNLRGSAHTILQENIMGGTCARVCPTEILCEQACVRNSHEHNPVRIGLLQRYATDPVFANGDQLFERAAPTGKRIAVVGAGPAGLSCAHRLAMCGHHVVVFDRNPKAGGLNEYGIAAYKVVGNFAQREVEWILSIGGIEIRSNVSLGSDISLAQLRAEFDAVFLGIGLASVNELGADMDDMPGIENAIDYIAALRQATDLSELPVGRNVVVVGGGMTAIDIAVQSRRLGAESVDIVYRRGPEQMGASPYEQDLARTNGVAIHYWVVPTRFHDDPGARRIELGRTALDVNGRLELTGQTLTLPADVVFKAIGQRLDGVLSAGELARLDIEGGKIAVSEMQATSIPGVWAGGDCATGGDDLTVTAVQQGKIAGIAIDRYLRG